MNAWCTETSIERLTLSLTWNDTFSEENVYISLKILHHFMFQLNLLSMQSQPLQQHSFYHGSGNSRLQHLECDKFIKFKSLVVTLPLDEWFPTFWMSVGPQFLRVKPSNKNSTLTILLRLLGLENIGTKFLQDVKNHSTSDTASHPRRS